ncbi:hypothetical protein KQI61_05865 [Anaerocolumna aminovalerica]|uniref:DNA polymerase domain-containing protein n=1 Tax=Anaerocolumna aminovalerica TaxID=1527 RepID=UPI001C0ECE7A|nr:DNA polymerase domain-containing protein [Anaerocolumna aminovalerica]MBU5331716.1 hypothetical protein [Anaerocolumna aminovalerica]
MKDFKIWGYDFEIFSKINWWCVTFINFTNQDEIITIINDRDALIDFYNSNKNDIMCGYNSRQYDQYIFKGILDGMNPSYINEQLITYNKKGYQVVKNAKKYPLNNYDVILKDKSLKQLEAFMGDMIKETDVPFDIDRPLTDEEISQIVSYNIHDVKETLRTLKYTISDFEAQLDMVDMFELDMEMFNKTKAQLSAKILGAVDNHTIDDEFEITIPSNLRMPQKYKYIIDWFKNPENMSYKLPLKSESNGDARQLNTIVAGIPTVIGYGGVHASQDNKIFEGIIVTCDVASLYPSLMINEGYLSRKLINPSKFKEIRDRRLKLKAKKDKRQQPLKIVINATYGILKDRNSACFDPLMSSNVCIAGQLYLIELTARIEDYCEVLQVNTDGIYVKVKDLETVDKIKSIAREWEQRTNLDLEWDVYENGKLVQKDVNNYILIDKLSEQYKCKGAYVKKLSPIDYDLPIVNKALVNYFVHNIPVEETINNCDDLIEFQKVIKLTNLYKGVVYGEGKKVKINGKDKIMVYNGKPLKEKVHRVFASNRISDKGIYKVKIEKGQKSYEKVALTPDKCFIDNESLGVDWYYDENEKVYKYNTCKKIPEYLDKQYYIDLANERIKQFLTPEELKIDETPNILFECMKNATNFYEFLVNCNDKGITKKVLEDYLIADCCNIYGKTQKLLTFRDYFNLLYGKEKFTVSFIEKKIKDEEILTIIISNASLSTSGKSYTDFNFKKALLKIFNVIPNEDIHEYRIMEMQIKKFNSIRYINKMLDINRWFVMNTRNIIAPNLILYNMKTGEIQYRKVKKEIFNILPLQDGDIIDELSSELTYGVKIIGKDEYGKNILAADIDKQYDVITKYEIVYRNYKTGSKLISDMGDDS